MTTEKILRLFLILIAIHSFLVGLALIFTPSEFFTYLGYARINEKFFPTQGGIFHFVMSIAYSLAAYYLHRESGLVILTIAAKMLAMTFLLFYYLFVDQIWMILVSGLLDGLMGWVILLLYRRVSTIRKLDQSKKL